MTEIIEMIRAQMFVSLMCRKTSTNVSGSTKYPSGRLIAFCSPSANGICAPEETKSVYSVKSSLVMQKKAKNYYYYHHHHQFISETQQDKADSSDM